MVMRLVVDENKTVHVNPVAYAKALSNDVFIDMNV